ncbi:MAG TPA: hypothetical protein ENK34_12030 [Rhodobacteraceae bacterium]|nr:hypothetical protein [Paracoccaceae bacterium]
MAEKLTDPSKAAHEIFEVLEDGDAIRNDGVRLQAANKNPWYVLATIYGEQPEGAVGWKHDKNLAAKNRRAWNGWFCGHLSDEERADRALKTGLEQDDLAPLGNAELKEIEKRFASRMGKGAKLPRKDETINFSKTFFLKFVCFEKFVFENKCNFHSAGFQKTGYFCSSVFIKEAHFRSAIFMSHAGFASVTFCNYAGFRSAQFCEEASFKWYEDRKKERAVNPVRFFDIANFSSAIFKSTARFNEAQFNTHVPEFHAAELYDDTVFPTPDKYTENWPKLKGEGVMPAEDQKRAYNRLRLFMNKSLQIDEEQFFHRQEMRCKTVLARWYHKPFYWLFSWFSDYGISVWRPLFWMVFVMAFGFVANLWINGNLATLLPHGEAGMDWSFGLMGEDDPWAKPRQAAGWSISNTLPFLGSGKYFTGDEFALDMSAWLKFIGWLQTLFGYILLFFLGLGLRNRFRLR